MESHEGRPTGQDSGGGGELGPELPREGDSSHGTGQAKRRRLSQGPCVLVPAQGGMAECRSTEDATRYALSGDQRGFAFNAEVTSDEWRAVMHCPEEIDSEPELPEPPCLADQATQDDDSPGFTSALDLLRGRRLDHLAACDNERFVTRAQQYYDAFQAQLDRDTGTFEEVFGWPQL